MVFQQDQGDVKQSRRTASHLTEDVSSNTPEEQVCSFTQQGYWYSVGYPQGIEVAPADAHFVATPEALGTSLCSILSDRAELLEYVF